MEKAKRYNKGKPKYGALPPYALSKVVDVYSRGAHKYTMYRDKEGSLIKGADILYEEAVNYELVESGMDNWRKGQSWTENLESVQRHIEAFRMGEDFDPDLGTFHLGNAVWGLLSILEYYKIHPELDDRIRTPSKVVSLDIDDVVCSLVDPFCKMHDMQEPCHWLFDYEMEDKLSKLGDDFWLDLKPCFDPTKINFEISYYITARDESLKDVTKEWIVKNNFPNVPIIFSKNKGKTCKEMGVQVHLDDSIKNFDEVNAAGTACFLLDRPWNRWKDVGYRRLKEVTDLNKYF